MTDSTPVEDVARQFAQAIDAEDYAAAGKLLAGAVVYSFRGMRLLGRDKVIDSFSQSEQWTRRTFDEVHHDYSSHLVSESVVRVRYLDAVRCGEQRLNHRSEQLLEIDSDRGVITYITHIDVPGEAQRLEQFMTDCGLG